MAAFVRNMLMAWPTSQRCCTWWTGLQHKKQHFRHNRELTIYPISSTSSFNSSQHRPSLSNVLLRSTSSFLSFSPSKVATVLPDVGYGIQCAVHPVLSSCQASSSRSVFGLLTTFILNIGGTWSKVSKCDIETLQGRRVITVPSPTNWGRATRSLPQLYLWYKRVLVYMFWISQCYSQAALCVTRWVREHPRQCNRRIDWTGKPRWMNVEPRNSCGVRRLRPNSLPSPTSRPPILIFHCLSLH